ncbi:MAG: fluoride efflux transporter CrcB [Acidobacteriota bacterium]
MLNRVLMVGAGGFLGTIARYGLTLLISGWWKRGFPLATLIVNVSGSLLLGFVATYSLERNAIDPLWRLFFTAGFLGAFTTFSTFEYETQRLTEGGAPVWALANVLFSVLAGFAAVQLGVVLARR